jgi:hypothetical protein
MSEKGISNSLWSLHLWRFMSSHVDETQFTPNDRERISDEIFKLIEDVYEERVRCSPPH